MLTQVFGRTPEPWLDFDPTRSRAASGTAVAATANPLASWAAVAMLQAGGSAIDAAIAAQAVLTVVEPNASGIGGGALIVAAFEGETRVIDGLSAAPARVTDRLTRDFDERIVPDERASFGGRTVGVPGGLRALDSAHAQFGRLPWACLFEPAISLAADGFPLSPYLLRALRENPAVQTEAMAHALYCGGGAAPLASCTQIRNPALARTLRQIASQGVAAFYEGEIARDICATVAADAFPGTLTLADLAAYRAEERSPARFALGDMQVAAGCLPAFGGIAVGQVVGIAAALGLRGIGLAPGADEIHILAEAGRLAYADRADYAGDPDFIRCNMQALLDPSYLARRAALLNPRQRTSGIHSGTSEGESMTSHLSIADAQGGVVAMTTTINNNFGARISVGGFYLNNVMTNFAGRPSQNGRPSPNALKPRRRARTSIAPCLVFDAAGKPFAAIGAGGGNRIVGYVANGLLRLASGMRDPQAIVSGPHALNSAGMTEVEPPLYRHTAELASRGHWMMPRRLDGGTQMIVRSDRGWTAGGDPRRDGAGMGLLA